MKLKKGDRVIREPECLYESGEKERSHKKPVRMEGVVTYIHPFGWYHIVEFTTRGGKLKESFWGTDV